MEIYRQDGDAFCSIRAALDANDNLQLNKMYMKKFNTDFMILDKEVNNEIKVIHYTGVGRKINENNLL